jgi:hypothetical protein
MRSGTLGKSRRLLTFDKFLFGCYTDRSDINYPSEKMDAIALVLQPKRPNETM